MCISISTTDHPEYPLIILSNRDEYFARPTQRATERKMENGARMYSPLDLGRKEQGTWIGVTSEGKIAMLLNYREKQHVPSKVSRGILPIEYLTTSLNDEEWFAALHDHRIIAEGTGDSIDLSEIGGFTLIYGKLEMDPASGKLVPLNIMSNRGERGKIHVPQESVADGNAPEELDIKKEISHKQCFCVSNSLYYEPWVKAESGVSKLTDLVAAAVASSYTQDELAEGCFGVLSSNTYDPEIQKSQEVFSGAKMLELRKSIFIPPIETGMSSSPTYYGTRTQTVIMYHKSGTLHYYERDLYDGDTDVQNIRNQHFEIGLTR